MNLLDRPVQLVIHTGELPRRIVVHHDVGFHPHALHDPLPALKIEPAEFGTIQRAAIQQRQLERGRHAAVFWRNPEGEWRCDPGTDSIQSLAAHVEAYAEALEELDDRVEEARRATEYFEIIALTGTADPVG